jgi:hypothetical protein
MASQSIISPLAGCTIMNELNDENNCNNDVGDSNRINLDKGHQQIDNEIAESHSNNKNKFTAARKKSILTSTENVSSITTEETTMAQSSQVWQYANRCPGTNYSTCCLCPDKKRISTNNGSTSTLRKHLISKHQLHDLALPPAKRKRTVSSITNDKKQHLHGLFIKCIVRDGRTFNDFQKPGMKKVLEELIPGKFIWISQWSIHHHIYYSSCRISTSFSICGGSSSQTSSCVPS